MKDQHAPGSFLVFLPEKKKQQESIFYLLFNVEGINLQKMC